MDECVGSVKFADRGILIWMISLRIARPLVS
jgi:hypothetical protein